MWRIEAVGLGAASRQQGLIAGTLNELAHTKAERAGRTAFLCVCWDVKEVVHKNVWIRHAPHQLLPLQKVRCVILTGSLLDHGKRTSIGSLNENRAFDAD